MTLAAEPRDYATEGGAMEFLKNQLARIREQLAGLSASQRMLAGTLVVIMVMTLVWWTRYAGQAEMEPVLDQAFAAEDIQRVTTQLQAKGIKYKVQGDRILVAADRKAEVLADLAYSQSLPRDTKSGFDELIKNSSPWMPASEKEKLWNKHKEVTLANVIRGFPGVSNAMVIIDNQQRPEIALSGGVQPSATINLSMKGGQKPDAKLVNAAANLVKGAVASLSKVTVIADGVTCPVANPEMGGAGGTWLEDVKEAERYFAGQLREHLQFVPGAMIAVRVTPNYRKTEIKERTHPKVKAVAVEEENSTSENKSGGRSGGEPGVVPNIGGNVPMDLSGGGSGSESASTSEEKTKSRSVPFADMKDEVTTDPGGNCVITGVSVFVPRSYFVRVCKLRTSSEQEPSDAALKLVMDSELPAIKSSVKACFNNLKDEAMSIAPYTDLMPASLTTPAPSAASSVTGMFTGHVKEIAVGALAVMSLLIVSMMVRRSSPAPIAAPQQPIQARQSQTLTGREELAGEATEGGAALDAVEVDDDAVRAQQMLEQVSTMVKDDPDTAATLVKRWLNRT